MIHVIGHLHPDSDAVCSAVMVARWLTLQGRTAQAWRCGEVNRETELIFSRAALPLPGLLSSSLSNKDIWLVDFNEPGQGPDSLITGNIVGIIDHHRLGGLITRLPPEVCIKPVGSTATVIWQLMDARLRAGISASEAILLLGALLSDTVALRSPTTTPEDRLAADGLAGRIGIDYEEFIADLLTAKTSVAGLSARELLHKDLKRFDINGVRLKIAQLELYSLTQLAPQLDALLEEMNLHAVDADVDLVVLMVTDINACASELYFSTSSLMPGAQPRVMPGMMSRKKQLLPWLQIQLNPARSPL